MKTIGMIGGLSWHSTIDYYRAINQQVQDRLGGMASAKIVLFSLNFAELRDAPTVEQKRALLAAAVDGLKRAGADFFVVCANTTHSHFPHIPLVLPFVHVAEVVFEEAVKRGFRKVGLLATKKTVEAGFYPVIGETYGVDVVVPTPPRVEVVDRIIQKELLLGHLDPSSRLALEDAAQEMRADGADAVILGCTELPGFFGDVIGGLPTLDSLALHVARVVATALDD